MPLVELSVRPGSAISISGLIRHDSSFLKEWTGSDRVHVSRLSFICPSATWPRLKPPLDLGASSTSILEPGLDGRQVLSQRLQLALFATRHFLLLPLQPFTVWSQFATLSCNFWASSHSAFNKSRSRINLSRSSFAWSLSKFA